MKYPSRYLDLQGYKYVYFCKHVIPTSLKKRQPDIVVISDTHLGTYGCQAEELLIYLSSIKPKKLILNGDIVDIWQFRKQYFPASHLRVIKKLLSMASNGTEIIYVTGNHDEKLRRFSDSALGNLKIVDKLLFDLDGKRTWIFHGDVFDSSMQHAKWLAKLGSHGYNALIRLNRFINWCLQILGKEKFSLSKKIKNSVKRAVSYLNKFESTVADVAIENEIDTVVCGHIHHPKKTVLENKKGHCLYLNSGDWVENLTALEYSFKRWKIYYFNKDKLTAFYTDEELKELSVKDIMQTVSNVLPKNMPREAS